MLAVKFRFAMNKNFKAFNSYSFTFAKNIGSPISSENTL
jgi:hypothetical protein